MILSLSTSTNSIEINTGNILTNPGFTGGNTSWTNHGTTQQHHSNYGNECNPNTSNNFSTTCGVTKGSLAGMDNGGVSQTVTLTEDTNMGVPEIQRGFTSTMSTDIWFWHGEDKVTMTQTLTDSSGDTSTQIRVVQDDHNIYKTYTDSIVVNKNTSTDFDINARIDIDDLQNSSYHGGPDIDNVELSITYNTSDGDELDLEDELDFEEDIEFEEEDFTWEEDFSWEDDYAWEDDFYFEEDWSTDWDEGYSVGTGYEMEFDEDMYFDMPEEFEEFVTTDMPDEFEDMYMEEFEEFETFEDAFMEEPEEMEMIEEFEEMEMTEEFEEMEPMEEEFEEMEVAEEETIDMEVEEEENTMEMEGEDENEEMEVAEDEESMEDTEGTDEEPESEVAEESEPEERTQEVAANEEEEIGEDDIDAGEVTDGKITVSKDIKIGKVEVGEIKVAINPRDIFKEAVSLDTYSNKDFYRDEGLNYAVNDDFFDQLSMLEYSKEIYKGVTLIMYIQGDPVEIYRKELEELAIQKSAIMIELKLLRGE